jgi:hypothetical protein
MPPGLPFALVLGLPVIHWMGVTWSALIRESLGLALYICSCALPLAGIALLLALSGALAHAVNGAPPARAEAPIAADTTHEPRPGPGRRASRRRTTDRAATTAACGGASLDGAVAVVRQRGLYDTYAAAGTQPSALHAGRRQPITSRRGVRAHSASAVQAAQRTAA